MTAQKVDADELAARDLPTELFDEIKDLVFTVNEDAVVEINKDYKPPSNIQVDRRSRSALASQYYQKTTFAFQSKSLDSRSLYHEKRRAAACISKWLLSLEGREKHFRKVRTILVPPATDDDTTDKALRDLRFAVGFCMARVSKSYLWNRVDIKAYLWSRVVVKTTGVWLDRTQEEIWVSQEQVDKARLYERGIWMETIRERLGRGCGCSTRRWSRKCCSCFSACARLRTVTMQERFGNYYDRL